MAEVLAHKAASLACEAGTAPLISAMAAAKREEEENEQAMRNDHEDDADSADSSNLSRDSSCLETPAPSVASVSSGAASATVSSCCCCSRDQRRDGGRITGLVAAEDEMTAVHRPTSAACKMPLVLTLEAPVPVNSCPADPEDSDMDTCCRGSDMMRRLAMAVKAWDDLARYRGYSITLVPLSLCMAGIADIAFVISLLMLNGSYFLCSSAASPSTIAVPSGSQKQLQPW